MSAAGRGFLMAQDLGRAGPIPPPTPAGQPWAALLLGALLWALATVILQWLGEDEIIRGVRERTGPPVVQTSPGVYE